MLNFKPRPTKSLEELELIEINLIKNLPLEYAYVMPKSSRVIQKESRESLIHVIHTNPFIAEYVKLSAEREFELTSSIPEFEEFFSKVKIKSAVLSLVHNLFMTLTFVLVLIFQDQDEKCLQPSIFIGIMIYLLVSLAISIHKIVRFKRRSTE